MRRAVLAVAVLALFASPSFAATFTVGDPGIADDATPGDGFCQTATFTCTLRAAVTEANFDPGFDTIDFAAFLPTIVDGPVQYAITSNVSIDGGFDVSLQGIAFQVFSTGSFSTIRGLDISGTPSFAAIHLNGASNVWVLANTLHGAQTGVFVQFGANNTIGGGSSDRNVIHGNTGPGIEVAGGTNHRIFGNYVGLLGDGTTPSPNGGHGIGVYLATGTIVGGTGGDGNLIGGNTGQGIEVGSNATATLIGNVIGVDSTGLGRPNTDDGVRVNSGAAVMIGGFLPGAGNVIAGNGGHGINVQTGSGPVTILGNKVGVGNDGVTALPNTVAGIFLDGNSTTVGGSGPFERNVIAAASTQPGVRIGSSGTGTVILGNHIGVNAAGFTDITPGKEGIYNQGTGTRIGGSAPGEGNVISGWEYGVVNFGPSIELYGNMIGVTTTGTGPIPNTGGGIVITTGTATIGSLTPGDRNVVSGNGGIGIATYPGTATAIAGNYIGLSSDGISALGNFGDGIVNDAVGTTVTGNVISGNSGTAITNQSGGSITIRGNTIGFNAAGILPRQNSGPAAVLFASGTGTLGGATAAERNVILGQIDAVQIQAGAANVTVRGNHIGLNAPGDFAWASLGHGVVVNGPNATIGPGNYIAGTNNGVLANIGSGTLVTGNVIGLSSTPVAPFGNSTGVQVAVGASNVTISGNTISANNAGINNQAAGTVIQGNLIGTDPSGTIDFGNTGDGILNFGTGALIGGALAAHRNVISGNGGLGIDEAGSLGSTIQNNFVGTNAAGTSALPNNGGIMTGSATILGNVISGNTNTGVSLNGSNGTIRGNFIGTDPTGSIAIPNVFGAWVGGTGHVVGGTTAADRNIISGNLGEGLHVRGFNHRVEGNFLGTNAAGSAALPNTFGITLGVSTGVTIGGTAAGAGNLVSGNSADGINNFDGGPGNTIEGNLIGLALDGTTPLPNGTGIRVQYQFLTDTTGPAIRNNIIGSNVNDGIVVAGPALPPTPPLKEGPIGSPVSHATGTLPLVPISRNSIFANGGLGIDLADDGITPNDSLDADTGPNTLQNYPVITSAIILPSGTTISGSLNSTPTTSFTLEFFSNVAGDPEGRTFIGTTGVTTDALGNANFAIAPATPITSGQLITATATEPANGTSEFSAAVTAAAPGVLDLSSATYSVAENGGSVTITVNRTGGSDGTVTVNYATAAGTATTPADFTNTSNTLTFGPGVVTSSFNVPITDDGTFEGAETFTVTLSSPGGGAILGTQTSATVTITDNEAQPAISVSDVTMAEGNVGATIFTFAITLSHASAQTITVNFATADGSATTPGDYFGLSGTATFNPGITTQNVLVQVNGDATVEGDETFTLNLSVPANATIADGVGLGTVLNDEGAAVLMINDVTVNESAGTATFNVTLSAPSDSTVTVNYATSDVTAAAGADYTTASSMLTFAPGITTQPVAVSITNDATDELNETFTVTLSGATNAIIGDPAGTGTITDDDAAPVVTISDVSAAEATSLVFTLTLTGATSQTVTVNYATADGTASALTDYNAAASVVTFAPGVTTQTITVTLIDDAVFEANETLFVNLTGATNATIGDNQAIGTITNDDSDPPPPPVVPIPTMSEWMLVMLGLALAGVAMKR